MFNKKFINFLCKYLAIGMYIIFGLGLIIAIESSNNATDSVAGDIGYFIGTAYVYTFAFALVYLLVAALRKYNNSK